MAAALAARGHQVETADLNSGLHVITIGKDGLTGAADKRREGLVLGR
jgi:gamma-glutamyltranspeptidase/glutathione hydrolase